MQKKVPEFMTRLRARKALTKSAVTTSTPVSPVSSRDIYDFMTQLLKRDHELQGATLVLSSGQQMAILPLYRDGLNVPTEDMVVLQHLLEQELALRGARPASGVH